MNRFLRLVLIHMMMREGDLIFTLSLSSIHLANSYSLCFTRVCGESRGTTIGFASQNAVIRDQTNNLQMA